MKIIKDGEYLEFEVNEGLKNRHFEIKIPTKDEYTVDNRKLLFYFSKSTEEAMLENLTITQSMNILLEFLDYYKDYKIDYNEGEYCITINEEEDFYIKISLEKQIRKLSIFNYIHNE